MIHPVCECGAYLQGVRCPWDRGQGCTAKELRGRSKIVRVPRPVEHKPKVERVNTARPERPRRVVCAQSGHPPIQPGKRCRPCARQALQRWRGRQPLGPEPTCLWCGVGLGYRHHGGPAKRYCSVAHRGRVEKERYRK